MQDLAFIQAPFPSYEVLGSMHGMPFGVELMSPSEYPQLPLVHIHATAAPAARAAAEILGL